MSAPSPTNPYAPPTARVADIADAGSTVELAGRGQRLGAFIVDLVIGCLLYIPPAVVAWLHWNPGQPWLSNFLNGGLRITGVLVLILIVVTIVLVARYGQTIGKRAVGIRVARPDGSKASLGRIFWLRNVVNGVLGAVVGGLLGAVMGLLHFAGVSALLVGYLYPLVDTLMIFGAPRRCLHDSIADTIVVKA